MAIDNLQAVEQAVGPNNISARQKQQHFRKPDNLPNPSEVLKNISPEYQKISGSRAIGKRLHIGRNRSHSFNVFIAGIGQILSNQRPKFGVKSLNPPP